MVYSLLSMLGTHDKDDMSQTLLAMSNSQDSCVAMRQSGITTLTLALCTVSSVVLGFTLILVSVSVLQRFHKKTKSKFM